MQDDATETRAQKTQSQGCCEGDLTEKGRDAGQC